MDNIMEYAPIIITLIMFSSQYKVFITPEQLERKHREILEVVENRFASKQNVDLLKEQLGDVKEKIDKIYDYIIESSS